MSEVNKYITSIPTLGLHSTFKHRRFPEYGVKLLTNINLTELNMKTMQIVDRVSPITGNTNSMFMLIDVADYKKWRLGGGLIQDLMPYLSADEREFLMTGIMPEEWGQAFPDAT
tara:strand:- start:131 stop:472 length:342 start_codon:yes stop_codon:yes gene_type:complete